MFFSLENYPRQAPCFHRPLPSSLVEVLVAVAVPCFWGLDRAEPTLFHKIMPKKEPPKQIHETVSVKALALQYQRLSAWVRGIEHLPFGHEFFQLESLTLRKIDAENTFRVTVKDVQDASRWPPRYIPGVGKSISTFKHGLCLVVAIQKKPDMSRFYQYIMASDFKEIQARGVWHVVYAWHFYVHASTSSESLAESVGSLLSGLRRQNVSHSLGTKRIAWGTQLKAAGLRGTGGEDGIMAMALNIHFDSRGPEGWHFVSKNPADGGKTSLVQIRAQARLSSQPAWVASYLTEAVRRRNMVLCKHLPRAQHFFVDSHEKRSHEQKSGYSKRQRVAELSERAYEPKQLSETLWRHLGINPQSLSHNLRPGLKPR